MNRSLRRPRTAALAVGSAVVLATGAVATAVPAAATPVHFTPLGRPFTGDLTGDGVPDRVQLGENTATTCFLTVSPGLPGGEDVKQPSRLVP